MSKHTPGPWAFEASNGDDCGMIVGKTAVVCDFVDDPREADARLIVAAPDLLAALQVVLRDYKAVHGVGDLEMQPALYQASAAIQKAEKSE